MKKQPTALAIMCCASLLMGCGIFPKEEELQKTPIIQAYEQEPFHKVQVQRGDLKLYEKINAVCMNVGEKQYSFTINDMTFKGIYVSNGDHVQAGTLLADLVETDTGSRVDNEGPTQLIAQEDGIVTFVRGMAEGEKSIAGQIIVIMNSKPGFYLNAYTKNWQLFTKGQQVVMRIRGKEYKADVVEAEDIGLPPVERPTDSEDTSSVYFYIDDEGAYLQSGDSGEVSQLISEKKDVLYIPKGAITTVDDRKIVYVEDHDGLRSVKDIETGLETEKYTEVVSGLQEGDSIILE